MKKRGESSMDLQRKIRDLIISGVLSPAERLKEEALAKRFRVSRTPLRQALIAIEGEGLVQSRPNAGFVVAPLSAEEVSSLYPIVWTLEALALEEAFDLLRPSLRNLKQINQSFLKSRRNPSKAQELDAEFHDALGLFCPNRRLREIIHTEKRKISRYEHLYMGDQAQIEESAADHTRIIQAIEKKDRIEASAALVDNWRHGMGVVMGRIASG